MDTDDEEMNNFNMVSDDKDLGKEKADDNVVRDSNDASEEIDNDNMVSDGKDLGKEKDNDNVLRFSNDASEEMDNDNMVSDGKDLGKEKDNDNVLRFSNDASEEMDNDNMVSDGKDLGKEKANDNVVRDNNDASEEIDNDNTVSDGKDLGKEKDNDNVLRFSNDASEEMDNDNMVSDGKDLGKEKDNDNVLRFSNDASEEMDNDNTVSDGKDLGKEKDNDNVLRFSNDASEEMDNDNMVSDGKDLGKEKANDNVVRDNNDASEEIDNDNTVSDGKDLGKEKDNDNVLRFSNDASEEMDNDNTVSDGKDLGKEKANDNVVRDSNDASEEIDNDNMVSDGKDLDKEKDNDNVLRFSNDASEEMDNMVSEGKDLGKEKANDNVVKDSNDASEEIDNDNMVSDGKDLDKEKDNDNVLRFSNDASEEIDNDNMVSDGKDLDKEKDNDNVLRFSNDASEEMDNMVSEGKDLGKEKANDNVVKDSNDASEEIDNDNMVSDGKDLDKEKDNDNVLRFSNDASEEMDNMVSEGKDLGKEKANDNVVKDSNDASEEIDNDHMVSDGKDLDKEKDNDNVLRFSNDASEEMDNDNMVSDGKDLGKEKANDNVVRYSNDASEEMENDNMVSDSEDAEFEDIDNYADKDYEASSEDEEEGNNTDMDDHNTDMDMIDNDLDIQDEDKEEENGGSKLGSGCQFEELDEDIIERDQTRSGIYIRKQLKCSKTNTGKKKKTSRVYNNYHCCFICKKHTTNILKHLRTHKENKETKEIVDMKAAIDAGNSKDKTIIEMKEAITKKQVLLRCRGDHEHNMNVTAQGHGELLIARKNGQFNVKDYGPCPLCFEWMKIKSFSKRHQLNCPAKNKDILKQSLTKGEAITQSAVLVGLVSEKATKSLIKEVFPIMTRDEITEMAKNDPLIVALGNNWLRRNLANTLKRKYYTSSRMRGAARLLCHLHNLSRVKLPMIDYITPSYFDTMCEAALLCANVDADDEEDLASPSSALKIGFDIGRLAHLKLGITIREGNIKGKEDAEQFNSLMKMEWTLRVSKIAHLKLNAMKLRKTSPLPVPEDLASISTYLKSELKGLDLTQRSSVKTSDIYKRAVILTQTRLLTYNKRRSGELEALSMENYDNRSVGLDEADGALLGNELTDLEKHLIDSQQLIKIRGKNSKPVPILVPEDVVAVLEYIVSANVRRNAGVKTWNKYVFANAGEGVFRAYDSLKTVCSEISLSAPERITSVSMRKYIATLSQVIDMKEHELEWLCGHLGHTANIHKLHYRATSGFIERVNIGKLMLLQDLNVAGQFAGKRLQDIDIVDVVKGTSSSAQRLEPENTGRLDEDVFEDDNVPRKKKAASTRQAWSKDEEEELRKLFKKNFDTRTYPGLKDCNRAIHNSRTSSGLIHKRNWETIKKKVIRMVKAHK
ncbi:titin homolog [Pecten maximus]|uniref:titin homolog n=1 Tax=Pecten maximus TaxID=6579 RepID=UPI001458274E|nr:titin homolog [Pecten maximus]XP_033737473.1 titin homolog [Pecten maximus]XP_033737474.1 titin homolog [Pecten maximus]